MKTYYETPAGYTTIKANCSYLDAFKYAVQYREETGRVVALRYTSGCRFKVIVKV